MARITMTDTARLAVRGLRGHPLRFFLSALGIAIGVAAMVAVAGITQSSRAELNTLLAQLGTNLLRAYPADSLQGEPTRLPDTARVMLDNIGPVTGAASTADLDDRFVYRSSYVPAGQTNSLYVTAVDPTLLATLRGDLAAGHWFTAAEQEYPTVVLGSTAAQRLNLHATGTRVWLTDQWAVVVGILNPLQLAPELDSAAMVPDRGARTYLGADGTSTGVYIRTDEEQVLAVAAVVPGTASPQHPEQVGIDRPTDALTAQLTADDALNRLLLGLAGVGLLVGGIGVSNTMIIAVLERRSEIGLRRALGATRGNIATQFLAESVLMATVGGAMGAVLGYGVTFAYASYQGWEVSLPVWVGLMAIVVTALVGAVSGLYPAVKASRQPPTLALSSI